MITTYIANMLTKPGASPVFGSPAEFGLEYEDVEFRAGDGVLLSGWLVKGGSDKVIIQTHFGIQSSRSGYTRKDKGLIKGWHEDIVFLRHVKHLVAAGYSVLMYDLRNHGNSGVGTCPWITGGVDEYIDVIAAVDFISNHPDYRRASIGLLSICMGANSTVYGYGHQGGLQTFENIKAIIFIQPVGYDTFLRAMGIPDCLIERANILNLNRGGIDFHSTALSHVKSITVPTLLMQNKNDPWTDMNYIRSFYKEMAVDKEMFWIDGPKKRLAAYDHFTHQPDKMLQWFGAWM